MPDTNNFDQGSRNQEPHVKGIHADWSGAFAAMPQETPAADGWLRLQARLPAAPAPTRERRRWPVWLASVASLALVIVVPLRMQSTPSTTITGPLAKTPSSDPVTPQPVIDAGVEIASVAIVPTTIEDTHTKASTLTPSPASTARVRKPRRDRHMDPSQRPIRTAAQPADTTLIANAETINAPATVINQDSLGSLYAQSAQLEGLLSLARDDRVSTGTAAALTDALSGQIGDIDAALAQPGAGPQERNDLWRIRVDTLRQLVGIETTQRLFAARGQQYEAALVSID